MISFNSTFSRASRCCVGSGIVVLPTSGSGDKIDDDVPASSVSSVGRWRGVDGRDGTVGRDGLDTCVKNDVRGGASECADPDTFVRNDVRREASECAGPDTFVRNDVGTGTDQSMVDMRLELGGELLTFACEGPPVALQGPIVSPRVSNSGLELSDITLGVKVSGP